jgi:hypothetical protein
MRHTANTRVAAGLAAVVLAGCVAGCATTATTVTGGVVYKQKGTRVAVVFGDDDRALIHDYYAMTSRGLPPGLTMKKSKSSHGHAKKKSGRSHGHSVKHAKLKKNNYLPPGLREGRLPADLEHRLSALPEGYVRVRVGADIVLMDSRTRIVIDLIENVAF